MALELLFNCLLAQELGVQPEEVTLKLLRERRRALYYDPAFQWVSSRSGLRVISLLETKQLARAGYIFG